MPGRPAILVSHGTFVPWDVHTLSTLEKPTVAKGGLGRGVYHVSKYVDPGRLGSPSGPVKRDIGQPRKHWESEHRKTWTSFKKAVYK